MRMYKKNPAYPHSSFYLNGKLVDDTTVLAGDEYEPFARQMAPEFPAQLVMVDPSSLGRSEVDQVKAQLDAKAAEPPRHMGPITSENFVRTGDNGMAISNMPRVVQDSVVESKMRDEDDSVSGIALGETSKPASSVIEKTKRLLSDLWTPELFVSDFPGVTDKNCDYVMAGAKTLENLATASNIDLRKWGVKSNFFNAVRRKAKEKLEGEG